MLINQTSHSMNDLQNLHTHIVKGMIFSLCCSFFLASSSRLTRSCLSDHVYSVSGTFRHSAIFPLTLSAKFSTLSSSPHSSSGSNLNTEQKHIKTIDTSRTERESPTGCSHVTVSTQLSYNLMVHL